MSAVAIVHLMGQSTQVITYLENRFYTQQIAHNLLVDMRLKGIEENHTVRSGTLKKGDLDYEWNATVYPTSDSELHKVELEVWSSTFSDKRYAITAFMGDAK